MTVVTEGSVGNLVLLIQKLAYSPQSKFSPYFKTRSDSLVSVVVGAFVLRAEPLEGFSDDVGFEGVFDGVFDGFFDGVFDGVFDDGFAVSFEASFAASFGVFPDFSLGVFFEEAVLGVFDDLSFFDFSGVSSYSSTISSCFRARGVVVEALRVTLLLSSNGDTFIGLRNVLGLRRRVVVCGVASAK